jgi:small nuclear ribonucleoprotein (snRNP)-like protein
MRARAWRRWIGRRVVVNLRTGTALTGVLWRVHRGGLLSLRDAVLHDQGAPSPVRVDGEAIIELDHVDYCQVTNP